MPRCGAVGLGEFQNFATSSRTSSQEIIKQKLEERLEFGPKGPKAALHCLFLCCPHLLSCMRVNTSVSSSLISACV
jgi:hypothetical protein